MLPTRVAAVGLACAALLTLAALPAGADPSHPIPPRGVKAVVVASWGDCSSRELVWRSLNREWASYGSVPIKIVYDDPQLCTGTFTLADLEASRAETVILSDVLGGGIELTLQEVTALRSYVEEGHDLIGTFLTLGWGTSDAVVASLFGLTADENWYRRSSIDPSYELRNHKPLAKRLIRALDSPYRSGYASAQVPADGRWGKNDLSGATIVGRSPDKDTAITVYRAERYRAIYIASMPEYHGGTQDMQFLYNAIIYPKRGD